MTSAARPIPDDVADVLYALIDGWRPTMPELPRPTRFVWGDRDLSVNAVHVGVYEQLLEVACYSADYHFHLGDELQDKLFDGELANGWTFNGEAAGDAGKGNYEVNLGPGSFEWINSLYWRVLGTERLPTIWIGRLFGALDLLAGGNLRVRTANGNGAGRGSMRLEGQYWYYLIQQDEELFLVIHTKDGEYPQREALYNDFDVLQFVVGSMLKLDILYGIGAERSITALVGGSYGRTHPERTRRLPPTPQTFNQEVWGPLLFEKVSLAQRTRPELRLYTPLVFYIEALTAHFVQVQYLKLHVALEAFAFWISQTLPPPPERVDREKWIAWVESHESAIRALAVKGNESSVYSTIRGAFDGPRSSSIVKRVFAEYKLTLSGPMKEELGDRNLIVHRAEMFDVRKPEIDEYRQKVDLVRCMLVALVGLAVGYNGEIIGWESNPNTPAPPEWWPVSDAAREVARAWYRAVQTSG